MSKHVEIVSRWMFWTDTHCGTWANSAWGNYTSRKTHNVGAIKAATHFAEDFRPDVFIHGGDLLDCAPISHWNAKRAAEVSRTNLLDDVNITDELVLKPMFNIAEKKVVIVGNHDAWLDQFLQQYPCLKDILGLDPLLKLKERGFQIVQQGKFFNLQKLFFAHGDTIARGKYHSHAAVNDYMRNIVYGHRHSFQAFSRKKPLDKNEALIGWSIPGLCDLNPHYSKSQINEWMHGFAYGYIMSDGTFSVYPVIMHNNRFALNGRIYKP